MGIAEAFRLFSWARRMVRGFRDPLVWAAGPLAVDTNVVVHWFLADSRDADDLAGRVLEWAGPLAARGRCFFVFDSPVAVEAKRTGVGAARAAQRRARDGLKFDADALLVVFRALTAAGLSCIIAPAQADHQLAQYVMEGCVGTVLTADSDLLLLVGQRGRVLRRVKAGVWELYDVMGALSDLSVDWPVRDHVARDALLAIREEYAVLASPDSEVHGARSELARQCANRPGVQQSDLMLELVKNYGMLPLLSYACLVGTDCLPSGIVGPGLGPISAMRVLWCAHAFAGSVGLAGVQRGIRMARSVLGRGSFRWRESGSSVDEQLCVTAEKGYVYVMCFLFGGVALPVGRSSSAEGSRRACLVDLARMVERGGGNVGGVLLEGAVGAVRAAMADDRITGRTAPLLYCDQNTGEEKEVDDYALATGQAHPVTGAPLVGADAAVARGVPHAADGAAARDGAGPLADRLSAAVVSAFTPETLPEAFPVFPERDVFMRCGQRNGPRRSDDGAADCLRVMVLSHFFVEGFGASPLSLVLLRADGAATGASGQAGDSWYTLVWTAVLRACARQAGASADAGASNGGAGQAAARGAERGQTERLRGVLQNVREWTKQDFLELDSSSA